MSTSSNPSPDDHDALSSWERRVLDDIEDDLVANDPRLARVLTREVSSCRYRSTAPWWPLSGVSTGLLIVALLVLVFVGVFVPTSSWVVLAFVTTALVVPWLLLAATGKNRSE